MESKQSQYNKLVAERKSCDKCADIQNPSRISDEHDLQFDSSEIGPWTCWQGNLDSPIMLIGQDWGAVKTFNGQKGKDNNSATNQRLQTLFETVGRSIKLPDESQEKGTLFFTNAILCMKSGGDQAPVESEWFDNCGKKFLKPLIEIVKPKVIICLGQRAYNSVMKCYTAKIGNFRAAVDKDSPTILKSGTAVFAVYHCSNNGRRNRDKYQQVGDWERIGKWLKEKNIPG